MALYYAQPGFVSGEMAPSLYGRVDLAKTKQGASVMRNAFVNYRGGILSRPGSAYVGMCKQSAPNAGGTPSNFPPRDIKFQFNINQGFDLEFGDNYMRVVSDGAYVTETPLNITGITQANPGVITIAAHGYSNGDWIYGANIGGMFQLNGLTWIVQNVTTNTFTLTDLFGNIVNTVNFTPYSSGGTFARIYTANSPYAAVDLPYLKFTQSANTMSLACWNQSTYTEYPPYELLRIADDDWTFTEDTFTSSVEAPKQPTAVANSSTTVDTWYSYVVTAVNSAGEESIASPNVDIQNNDININAGTNTISWATVPEATSYNVYSAPSIYSTGSDPGFIGASYGYIGSSFGTSFTDSNITADFTTTPPIHNNPFARGAITQVTPTSGGSGLSQATLEYEINTFTGSGFVGSPIVNTNGNFVGFVISDNGENYADTDTITLITGGTAATGSYTFTANPTNGQTIILNGITWTFETTPNGTRQTKIGINLAATLSQLTSDLFTSGITAITSASYSISTDVMDITYNELGTTGNSYTLAAGTYGGTVSGATLTGGANGTASGATATLTVGPEIGTYPGLVSYFQQRRVYASTINNPDTYYFSQTGSYSNFDASIPAVDSDSIIGTPWAQQVNGIQAFLTSPTGLMAFTGNGTWLINGGVNTAITPSDQSAQPQVFNGISPFVPPVGINYHILYVQSKGSIIRDLAFNIFVNVYTGEDITLISNHLFTGFTILQMAYAEEPFKVVWCVRNDGVMISLTYIAEQDIKAFARHDTNGFYVGVTTVTEPPVDAVYVIVQRYINGYWVYYKERFDNREWILAEDCFCVDAGLSYPMTYPNATLSPAAATGTANISGSLYIAGGTDYTAPTVVAIDPTGTGNGATFSVTVSSGVITAITPLTEGQLYSNQTYYQITDSTGSGAIYNPVITNNVNFITSASVFNSNIVGNVIRVGNGQAIITSYVSGTQVVANITQPITATVPNDPNLTPIPATSGNWSIAAPITVVGGLNHLQGLTVTGLADGGVITPQIVSVLSDGQVGITLPVAATAINVGLPFVAQLQTLQLDFPDQGGSAQGRRKNVSGVNVRFEQSRGFSIGTNQLVAATLPGMVNPVWTEMIEVKEANADIPLGQAIPLATGDYFLPVFNDWNIDGRVAFEQPYPLPMNITACFPKFTVGDTGSP